MGYALSKPRVSTQRLCAWCVVCVLAATTRSACRGPGAPGQHAAAAAPSANGGGGCVLPCPLLIGRGCSCSCSCSCCVGGYRANSRRDHITGRAAAGEAACRRGCCGERCGHTGSPSPHRGGYARCVVCWTPTPPSAVQPYRTRCPCSGDTGRAAEGHADGRWTDDDDGRCDACGRHPQAFPGSSTRCTATSACPDTRAATVANATSHSRPRSEAALSGVPCRRTGSCAGHSPASPACASGCASSDTCAGHCQPSEPNSNSAHPWSRAHGHRDGCQG